MPTVIHVSPHPDDESIAAPCTLLTLRDAGWRIVNLAASLGRPEQRDRRRRELVCALNLAGFEHRESQASGISRGDDLGLACRTLTRELRNLVEETGAELVVGPHPREGHHGHATVARAVRQTVWQARKPLTWWMWSVWSDLPRPTLVVDCTPRHLELSQQMLEQYQSENSRNDYRSLHLPVRQVNAVRGIEKVFGFGSTPSERLRAVTHAEVLTEVTAVDRTWMIGRPRVLDCIDVHTRWTPLDDWSLLSSTRLRPLYRPALLSAFARFGIPGRPVRLPKT